MPTRLEAGPYKVLGVADGLQVPWYMIPFDETGRCTGPASRRHLLEAVGAGGYTDIYLCAHGWNNDWPTATLAYEEFYRGYAAMRRDRGLAMPDGYRPLMVSVFWPSIILVGADEQAPRIAAAEEGEGSDPGVATGLREVERLGAGLPDALAERFYDLAGIDRLTAEEAVELGRLLGPGPEPGDDPMGGDLPGRTEDEAALGQLALALAGRPAEAEGGRGADLAGTPRGASEPSGGTDWFSRRIRPRDAIRIFTVYRMKDRAGVVGARGVGPLLVDLLARTTARVHLIGHSYGCKVLLSATCYPIILPARVESMLLLQPAVSHLCFAAKVPKRDRPGGYWAAPQRVRRPILATYSARDRVLHDLFHLAVRRPTDLGESWTGPAEGPATAAERPPSLYAALGGYGPRGAGEQLIPILEGPGAARYDLGPQAPPIYGLDARATIAGHGDFSNPSTWWALYNLAANP